MKLKSVQETFAEIPSTVTDTKARELIRAAERENEKAGGCCSGPGTAGTEHLRDIYLKDENGPKLRDLTVRTILSSYLQLGSQGVSKDGSVAKK